MGSFYDDLGVAKDASMEDIKRAYKRLAMKNHPDKGGDPEAFKKISVAYETLSDPQKRREYDSPPQGFPGGFPFPFTGGFQTHVINVTLDDVFHGKTINLNVMVQNKCKGCSRNCRTCDGRGTVNIEFMPMMIVQQPCPGCRGEKQVSTGCADCKGTGHQQTKERRVLHLPKGFQNGYTEVLKGLGDNGRDLHIVFQVLDHPVFKREGQNFVMQKKITFIESLIGLHFGISRFGEEIIHHEPGPIDPRKRYTVKNKDIIVVYDVEYPQKPLAPELRELLKNSGL
jgi:DnaJ family protein A protein 2